MQELGSVSACLSLELRRTTIQMKIAAGLRNSQWTGYWFGMSHLRNFVETRFGIQMGQRSSADFLQTYFAEEAGIELLKRNCYFGKSEEVLQKRQMQMLEFQNSALKTRLLSCFVNYWDLSYFVLVQPVEVLAKASEARSMYFELMQAG